MNSNKQQPIMPNSSPHTAKMLSVCRAFKLSLLGEWVRVPRIQPMPVSWPDPMAARDWLCCQPLCRGSRSLPFQCSTTTRKRMMR